MESTHVLHPDGKSEGLTRQARELLAKLGLNDTQEVESRLLWIGIVALAKRCDPVLFKRLMGYPDDLPNLAQLHPPEGNTRPNGVASCYFAQRRAGTLAETY